MEPGAVVVATVAFAGGGGIRDAAERARSTEVSPLDVTRRAA